MKSNFHLTSAILKRSEAIVYILGGLDSTKLITIPFKLRKDAKIRSIHSSLAIEGNRLTTEQITAILEGKKILGPHKDILEIKNAIEVYKSLKLWNSLSLKSLLKAHRILMRDLVIEKGKWRSKGVVILKSIREIIYTAPPAKDIPDLIKKLFSFIRQKDLSWLIKACIFHYEFEMIHPFVDGNGRIGRLWQQLLLMKANSIFEYIPVEFMIKNSQKQYYKILQECGAKGDCTAFVEYSLDQILSALKMSIKNQNRRMTVEERLQYTREKMNDKSFERKEYMDLFGDISTSTASRDLEYGLVNNLLKYSTKRNLRQYQFLSLEVPKSFL